MSKVLVVGGGAAGMFAAIFAAYNGNEVHLFEKNGNSSEKTVRICRFFTFHRDVETVFNNVKMYDPQCLCGNLENIRIKMNFGVWKEKKLWKRIWFYV